MERNALDYVVAKKAEAQTALAREATDAQHRLNLIAALFLPITAVGSVLGMNSRSGLEQRSPAVAYRNSVLGRVWLTEFDWQDNDATPGLGAQTIALMKYMVTH